LSKKKRRFAVSSVSKQRGRILSGTAYFIVKTMPAPRKKMPALKKARFLQNILFINTA
jgi:hypothetical protein